MKSLILSILLLLFSISTTARDESVRTGIINAFNTFEGKVSTTKIKQLITRLTFFSSAEANMCFVSFDDYNDCQENAKTVYGKLYLYVDDLVGKEVTVTVVKSHKAWEDEDYYSLAIKMSYVNDNPEYPVDVNFDTFDMGIENDCIKDIVYSREWFSLSDYVKY
ncbi:hypothetical protein K6119_03425 [Paracrocinitomix mangrovi]|uniref:hypothetical protein n=1 Tax=Paracrocinitomix mangrovi TaxID=2862509 RepID=UPI001C8EB5EE|nr:hypothetical protein [Paracrocinitomix mangrovi]UKN02566.1 hypothetical protein K6119_03425 [Paracrocinitomix mangrovi]